MENAHGKESENPDEKVDPRSRAPKNSSSYVTDKNYQELLALGLCSTCGKCLRSPNPSCPAENHLTDDSLDPKKITGDEKVELPTFVVLKPMSGKRSRSRSIETSVQKNSPDDLNPNEVENKVTNPVTEQNTSYQELLLLGKCVNCEKSVQPYHHSSNQRSVNFQSIENDAVLERRKSIDNLSLEPLIDDLTTTNISTELGPIMDLPTTTNVSNELELLEPKQMNPITTKVSTELESTIDQLTTTKASIELESLEIMDHPTSTKVSTELEPLEVIIDHTTTTKVSTELEPIIDRSIAIKLSTELEPENIHTLKPITTEVLHNLAPLDTIQIRQPDQQTDEGFSNFNDLHLPLSENLSNPDYLEPTNNPENSEEVHIKTMSKSTQTSEDYFYKRRNTNESEGRRPHRFSLRKGEGFLDLEYAYPEDLEETVSVVTYYETTSASGSDEDTKDESQLQSEIAEKAQEIKRLVTKKSMGLPQAYSEQIIRLTEEIITQHTDSTMELTKELFPSGKEESSKYSFIRDRTSQQARSMINIANQSRTILNKFSTTNDYPTSTNISGGEATEHLTKMVKKLHCRHQRLKRLAEKIVEKRWKLLNMHKSPFSINEDLRKPNPEDKREILKNTKSKSKIKTMYTNPLAKIRDISAGGSFRESWEESDPLWKAVNTVGLREERNGKCVASSEESKSQNKRNLMKTSKNNISSVFNSYQLMHDLPFSKEQRKMEYRRFESQRQWSALSLLISRTNTQLIVVPSVSKLSILVPHTKIVRGDTGDRSEMNFTNENTSKMVNDFVDSWKVRTYTIAILIVVLSALLHSAYICGARMGNNYMTHTMVKALSGMPWLAPTGIYALVFLGYLLGGMAVIKTASAKKHNENVKDYYRNRKGKVRLWYGLVGYFLLVWITRIGMWFSGIHSTEKEMESIYTRKFYYSEIPSRMLYTQYLFSCCGANGIGDYPEYSQIGWPKSCYDHVENYSSYYIEPKPMNYGCSAFVYKFSATAMTAIFGLCLVIWILAVIFPMHLYVYELFICMRSRELNPWLLDEKDK